jgi:hypothetical protein
MASPEWLMVVDLEVDRSILADWNHWYDSVHLQEIVQCPGFRSGTRYIAPASDQGAEGKERHLTVYEIDGPGAFESEAFRTRRGLGDFGDHVTVKTRLYRIHTSYARSE